MTDRPVAVDLDGADGAALQFIAEGARRLSGFDVVAISVVDTGVLRTVAVAGDERARAELAPLRTPVDAVLDELAPAETWGLLKFLPHDRAPGHLAGMAWIPSMAPVPHPNAWHPEDLLCALLRDEAGILRGVLSLDVPRNGLRPDARQRAIADDYARQAEQSVITALQRGELARALERERVVAEYRQTMTDSITHELRNSLGAITNAVELIQDELSRSSRRSSEVDESDVDRLFALAHRGGRRIENLVDDMLTISEMRRVPHQDRFGPVDLSEVVEEAHLRAAISARANSVEVGSEVEEGVIVHGRVQELDHLVSNLVSNAVKYSHPGGRVSVSLRRSAGEEGEQAELVVRDDGIGISRADQDRLFDEFFRADNDKTRARPGTGLGLAIAHGVATRHGGSIRIESALGKGSIFTVGLPLVPHDPAAHRPRGGVPERAGLGGLQGDRVPPSVSLAAHRRSGS